MNDANAVQRPEEIPERELLEDFNLHELNRMLDRSKAHVFTSPYASFFIPLMCAMNFYWSRSTPTAATNGLAIWINPFWFSKLPEETRVTVVLHELQHPARLHFLRGQALGLSEPEEYKWWNYACDIVINRGLQLDGSSFDGTRPWITDIYDDWPEEEIYNRLKELGEDITGSVWGAPAGIAPDDDSFDADDNHGVIPGGDLVPMTEDDIQRSLTNVLVADKASKAAGGNGIGDMPGNLEKILKQFLQPNVAWEKELLQFFNSLGRTFYSMRRPRRRMPEMYLSSKVEDKSGLDHIAYIWDVSGSIGEAEEVRFNSEVRYIKDRFDPKKMTLVQFDTMIQDVQEFDRDTKFEDIKVIGNGGTDLACVKDWIDENEPTAVIIFSDMYCAPMAEPKHKCPIFWAIVNNPEHVPPFGKYTYVEV